MFTDEFKLQANTLRVDLMTAAQDGRVTAQKPVTTKKIIERYKTLHPKWKLSEPGIREIVNYLRSKGEKIGSNSNGYFYMICKADEQHTFDQIESRIVGMLNAVHGMNEKRCAAIVSRMAIKFTRKANPKQELITFGIPAALEESTNNNVISSTKDDS